MSPSVSSKNVLGLALDNPIVRRMRKHDEM